MAQYERLSWSRTLLGSRRWYLGPDHLLFADRAGFSVDYRRFYFNDIQSLLVWPTRQGWVIAGIQAVLGGLLTWLFFLIGMTPGFVVAGLTVALVAFELLRGPRAAAEIRTPTAALRTSLAGRLSSSRRVLDRVYPFIRDAQGRVAVHPTPVDLTQPAQAVPFGTPAAESRQRASRPWSLVFALVFISLLLEAGLDFIFKGGRPSTAYTVGGSVLQLFGFAVLIVAIILSYRYYVRPGIRAYAWSVVAFRIGMYFVGLVTGIVLTARYHANMYSHLVTLSRAEGVGYVLLALAGIGLSLRNGGQFEVPPASQPVPSSATAGVMP